MPTMPQNTLEVNAKIATLFSSEMSENFKNEKATLLASRIPGNELNRCLNDDYLLND